MIWSSFRLVVAREPFAAISDHLVALLTALRSAAVYGARLLPVLVALFLARLPAAFWPLLNDFRAAFGKYRDLPSLPTYPQSCLVHLDNLLDDVFLPM